MGLLGTRFPKEGSLEGAASQEEADHKSHRSKPSNTRWQPLCHLQGVISRLPRSSSIQFHVPPKELQGAA